MPMMSIIDAPLRLESSSSSGLGIGVADVFVGWSARPAAAARSGRAHLDDLARRETARAPCAPADARPTPLAPLRLARFAAFRASVGAVAPLDERHHPALAGPFRRACATASGRARARRPRPARIRSGRARTAPAGRRARAPGTSWMSRLARASATTSSKRARRGAGAAAAGAAPAARARRPARADARRARGPRRRRRRRGARRGAPSADLGELAQRVLGRRQVGGVGEADQRHFGGGERARRILHVLDALEQDLPRRGSARPSPASARIRAPRSRSISLIAGSSGASGAIFTRVTKWQNSASSISISAGSAPAWYSAPHEVERLARSRPSSRARTDR